MQYSLLVLSSPLAGTTSYTAAQFAQAVLERGHSILRVFFLDEGVNNGLSSSVIPQNEKPVLDQWLKLKQQHNVELILCVSSALKRGVLDTTESERHSKSAATAHPNFIISGLGQLIDASANCERLITFGA